MKMRPGPITILFVFIMLFSCKKDQVMNNSNGVIVGWNYGACITCGGFYLNLSDDTLKGANTFYVLNYPDSLTSIIYQYDSVYNKNHAPIDVYVSWQPVPNQQNWLLVTSIRSR